MLGVILARGGSKGLPGKNLKMLAGKPLIQYSIEQALAAEHIETIVVSTDDPEIADVARKAGAEVPFLRPDELASDTATSVDAIMHAIRYYEDAGRNFSHIALLEPTSPLRLATDIDKAYQQLINTPAAESIVSMCQMVSAHPAFAYTLDEKAFINSFMGASSTMRRQEIADLYYPEGTIYISTTAALAKTKTFYHAGTIAYQVPKWQAFEIDDLEDFLIVEAIMEAREKGAFEKMY